MKVLLTGASGFIGRELMRELLKRGHDVVATSSRARKSDDPRVTWIKADFTDPKVNRPNFWRAVIRAHEVDAVINNAGIFEENLERKSSFETVNFHAAVALAEGAGKAGVGRFIQMSSAVAGKSYAGKVGYGSSKRQADDYIQGKRDLNWTIVRPDIVYSAESWGHKMSMDDIAAMPIVPILGKGQTRMQPIHVRDVAKAARLVESDAAKHQVLDASGPESIKMIDLLRTLKEARGETFRTMPMSLRAAEAFVKSYPAGAANQDFIKMLREEIQVVHPHHNPEPFAKAVGAKRLRTVADTYAKAGDIKFRKAPLGELIGMVIKRPGALCHVVRDLIMGVRDNMKERGERLKAAFRHDAHATQRAMGLRDNDAVSRDDLHAYGAAPPAPPKQDGDAPRKTAKLG